MRSTNPRRITALAAAVGALLAAGVATRPASAAVTLPYSKTVTVQAPASGYYVPEFSSGAWLNRCFASGGGDCVPHNDDVQIRRSIVRTASALRCAHVTANDVMQSETSSPTSTAPATGTTSFLFDFGFDANINGKFYRLKSLTTSGTLGASDFDVYWMSKLGSCSAAAEEPTTDTLASMHSNPGDEKGRVPGYLGGSSATTCSLDVNGNPKPGCPRYALVMMFSGDPGSRFKLTICSTHLESSCPAGS